MRSDFFLELQLKLLELLSLHASTVRERDKMRRCVCGQGARLHETASVKNLGFPRDAIRIGRFSHVRGELVVLTRDAAIELGEYCYVGEGARIWSADSIKIGDRALISHNVNIHDNNAHSTSARLRSLQFKEIISVGHPQMLADVATKRISIENDAWIGFNATILKGVTIGCGAIIGACAVVTQDIPPFSIAVGNPAKVIGQAAI